MTTKKPKRQQPRREIFVLTPGEKKAVALIAAAFLLGLGTMYYRAKHPRPSPPPAAKEQRQPKRAAVQDPSHRAGTTPVLKTRGARPAAARDAQGREQAD